MWHMTPHPRRAVQGADAGARADAVARLGLDAALTAALADGEPPGCYCHRCKGGGLCLACGAFVFGWTDEGLEPYPFRNVPGRLWPEAEHDGRDARRDHENAQ